MQRERPGDSPEFQIPQLQSGDSPDIPNSQRVTVEGDTNQENVKEYGFHPNPLSDFCNTGPYCVMSGTEGR